LLAGKMTKAIMIFRNDSTFTDKPPLRITHFAYCAKIHRNSRGKLVLKGKKVFKGVRNVPTENLYHL
jgi:hypothetical protein